METSNSSEVLNSDILDYPIFNSKGLKIKLSSTFSINRTMLVFVRHFNWFVCRDFVNALSKIPQEILESNKSNLIIIGCSPYERIISFAKDTNINSQILFTDPSLKLYNKLGLIRAQGFSQLKGKGEKSKETKTGMISGLFWSLKKSIFGKNGDVYQVLFKQYK